MRVKNFRKNNSGFSLIEIIIVIAIMAILAASIAPAVIRYIDNARKVQMLNVTRLIYDTCSVAVAQFNSVDVPGTNKTYTLSDGLNKTDKNNQYTTGNVGRFSSGSCYEIARGRQLSSTMTPYTYIDQIMAQTVVETLPALTKDDYATISPHNKTMRQVVTEPNYKGKFTFMVVYDLKGCCYVEMYYNGYFVHYDGTQGIDDIIDARKNPNVKFANVNN